MGKRKGRKKPPPKLNRADGKMPTAFDCPFCSSTSTVSCKMDHKNGVGRVKCSVCDAKYQTEITSLSAAVDVFNEWIEEADAANREGQD